MLKSELLAEIASFYTSVQNPFLIESVGDINWYLVNVFETGKSAKSKKPTGYRKNVHFYVYKEGTVDEKAYYDREELVNDVDSDVTGDNSLLSINKIYSSSVMRQRVQAAVAKAAQNILNEDIPSSPLTVNASSGQKNVTVETGFIFWKDKVVVVSDNNHMEDATVSSISSNTLTLTSNLLYSYTVADGAKVTYKDNKERERWAASAILNPDAYTLAMTSFVALDPSIQSAGGLATDSDIQLVVNSYINKLAVASLR